MAYQNVGIPRFYINVFEYLNAIGRLHYTPEDADDDTNLEIVMTNPTHQKNLDKGGAYPTIRNTILPIFDIKLKDLIINHDNGGGYVAYLGHNFGPEQITSTIVETDNSFEAYENPLLIESNIINSANGINNEYLLPYVSGFSIFKTSFGHQDTADRLKIIFTPGDYDAGDDNHFPNGILLGSLLIGNYWDMPHNANVNLTIKHEYDGIDTTETLGGSTLSNARHLGARDWGNAGAWQLDGDPNFRTSRKSWDLTFSFLKDTSIMPRNASTGYWSETDEGYSDSHAPNDSFNINLVTGTDFFSAVYNRCCGSHLPFLFQPDKDNNNPDQFTICKFVGNSLQVRQMTPNLYQVKVKIREVV